MKRTLDIAVALLVLGLSLPILVVAAIAIKMTSPGSVLFRATVHGHRGVPFTYYKLRTMRVNSDSAPHESFILRYVKGGASGGIEAGACKLIDDPRITRVGAIIRRFSLDEIPQMLNVLRGEMSIVGPRPPVPYEYVLYDDVKKRRLVVRPGITGLNQVRRRNRSTFEEMLADDLEYVERQSVLLDLAIMLRTPWVILFCGEPLGRSAVSSTVRTERT